MNNKNTAESLEKKRSDLANHKKSTGILNAFLIGLVIGVIIYGVAKNNLSFFTLIPLFIAYKVFNKPKK